MKKPKKDLENLKSAFIANASHELRTPLAVIRSNLDLALRDKSRDLIDPYETLASIQEEIERISYIIEDLSLLAHNDPGALKQALRYEHVSLDTLIQTTIKKFHALAKERDIRIETNVKKDTYVWGDREQLERLLANLIVNAIRYGKRGGWVRVILTRDATDVEITVADNGPGISKEDLPHTFSRFHRGGGDGKNAPHPRTGTGLGLALSKSIAQAHGGSITVESEQEKGSTFRVSLVLSKPQTSNEIKEKE